VANGEEVAAARLAASAAARGRSARKQAARNAKNGNSLHDPLNVRCAGCGGRTRLIALGGAVEAHKTPKRAWCGEGAKPQAVDITRAREGSAKGKSKKVKRSVRAISAGLPTLGKGR